MAKRYGCKWGEPHDLTLVADTRTIKVEVCKICNRKFRWPKGNRGRVENARYLEAHARNYAQKGGATHQLFMRLYEPEKCTIVL